MNRIRLILVDDHEVVRLGLITLLEELTWVEIVAEAGSAAEAIQLVEQHQPDVVVMDIRLPGESGIEACRAITTRWPDTRVIMLTSSADDEMIFKSLQAGASGYVLKQVGNQALVAALEAASKGEPMLDPLVTARVILRVRDAEKQHVALAFQALSEREIEVLRLVADGKSNAEIAAQLSLSEKTVGHHVSAILHKLNLTNRIEAATYAVRHHIEEYLEKGR